MDIYLQFDKGIPFSDFLWCVHNVIPTSVLAKYCLNTEFSPVLANLRIRRLLFTTFSLYQSSPSSILVRLLFSSESPFLQLNNNLEGVIKKSPSGGTALTIKDKNFIGDTWLWHNNSNQTNYGTVLGDYNDKINTELLLTNGKASLKITKSDNSVESFYLVTDDQLNIFRNNLPYASLYGTYSNIVLPYTATDYCRVLVSMVSTNDGYPEVSTLVNGMYIYAYQFNNKSGIRYINSVYLCAGDTLSVGINGGSVNVSAQVWHK